MPCVPENLRLVLVRPRSAGNIGACARLCANFGVKDWVLVEPQCEWDVEDSHKLATGNAGRLLKQVRVVTSLPEALQDAEMAIGFTRRVGKARKPSLELAELVKQSALTGVVALVFGNERIGLMATELAHCTGICTLPTSSELPSMNLSHAVAVVLGAFAISRQGNGGSSARPAVRSERASLGELEGLYSHFHSFLMAIGMNQAGNPGRLLTQLRKIFGRAELSQPETRALRGILNKAQVALSGRRRAN